jgi:hypothetical protein
MNELEYLANQSKVDLQHVPITKTIKNKNKNKKPNKYFIKFQFNPRKSPSSSMFKQQTMNSSKNYEGRI